jgi:ankyrin repeat protein
MFPACHRGPLYYASLCGLYDLANHLVVKHSEHVNARGGRMVSPLGAALHGKHPQIAELLYEHGADVGVQGGKERTLLHVASRDGLVDAGRWLLNHGADANAQDDEGQTPLHLAASNKHLEIVQILLEQTAFPRVRGQSRVHACFLSMGQILMQKITRATPHS